MPARYWIRWRLWLMATGVDIASGYEAVEASGVGDAISRKEAEVRATWANRVRGTTIFEAASERVTGHPSYPKLTPNQRPNGNACIACGGPLPGYAVELCEKCLPPLEQRAMDGDR